MDRGFDDAPALLEPGKPNTDGGCVDVEVKGFIAVAELPGPGALNTDDDGVAVGFEGFDDIAVLLEPDVPNIDGDCVEDGALFLFSSKLNLNVDPELEAVELSAGAGELLVLAVELG